MKMEGLSLYWNTTQNLFVANEEEDTSLLKLFVDGIPSKEETSSNYNYSTFLKMTFILRFLHS